ncbi:hypothetical protein RhiJN_24592 [Ceratobasidium sp. AG-Ba]|nr:hypothetical protein RhiJN_24592 [Ceratobasidium sp. AG-Ba]
MVSFYAWAATLVTGATALALPITNGRIDLKEMKERALPNSNVVLAVVADSTCGPIGATLNATTTAGPNGAQSWLSCGLNSTSGWNPPHFTLKDIIVKDLDAAANMTNSPFARCQPYFPYFKKYGAMYNVPPIMMASFANQESGCDPQNHGGAGEIGMMQITPDKCGGAPNGDCYNLDYNIGTATKYFADQYIQYNKNLLLALGQYNGWYKGMTVQAATAAANTPCCHCQQNLDYVHQMLNGWLQGVDVYATGMGTYFNLKVCDQPTSSAAATPAPTRR